MAKIALEFSGWAFAALILPILALLVLTFGLHSIFTRKNTESAFSRMCLTDEPFPEQHVPS